MTFAGGPIISQGVPVTALSLRQFLRAHLTSGDGAQTGRYAAAAQLIRQTWAEGHAQARAQLQKDRRGSACAQRLSGLMDSIITAMYAHITEDVFPFEAGAQTEHIALIAVGGYGRGTLAPFSDVDLLFLTPAIHGTWGTSVVEAMLYMLWDAGLKVGYAIRSLDDCIRLARTDMTIRTSMLEARFLAGNEKLAHRLRHRFDAEIVEGTAAEFVEAKLSERDERHRRNGGSRYVVEPNIKEGKGGLRDLNTLFWIAKYVYRVRRVDELVAAGLFTPREMRRFRACENMLWAVRCHLHFLSGRAEERLSFDMQPQIAQELSYQAHPGLKDVERFMKHYFLGAKDVGDFTAIICAALEARQEKERPMLDRFLNPFRRTKRRSLPDTPAFIMDNGRLSVSDECVFSEDPINLIRYFHTADKMGVALHPDAMRLITQSLKLITATVRNNPAANKLFMDILSSRNSPEKLLRHMNETGLLGKFIPDFGRIVALMQFNMYHHYTVDEHLLRAVGVLGELDSGKLDKEHPLSAEILPNLEHRRLLYVAVFLHDIAKGRLEDHSIAGARVARRLCPRLGLSPADTETVAWLIEHHLLMSIVAQSRDLSDPRTIMDFAQIVQSPKRLKLLLVLTVADIKAVGPGVWNGWKGQLLRMLYWETELVLAGGHSALDRGAKVRQAHDDLRAALKDWPAHDVETALARHSAPYWLKVDLQRQIAHAELLREADRSHVKIATHWTSDAFRSITEITVLAPDSPRLLSQLAGACAAAGANIADAYIHTTDDGRVLDSIFLNRTFEQDEDEARFAHKLCTTLKQTLQGKIQFREAVERRVAQRQKRMRAFKLEPNVLVTNGWSDRHTVIEVSGLDRPGLLHDLTAALSDLDLNIVSAHIATFGERAVDVFYVTNLNNEKIKSESTHRLLEKNILKAFRKAG
jgi:[protein-PII] uridylyltransferase